MPLGYPDTPRSFPNSYASNTLQATSTAVSTSPLQAAVSFGFNASVVKVTADVGTLYLNFGSTVLSAATTLTGYALTSVDGTQTFASFGAGCAGFSMGALTTTAVARVGAWG